MGKKKISNNFTINVKQDNNNTTKDESYLFVEQTPISIIKGVCCRGSPSSQPINVSIQNANELFASGKRIGIKDGILSLEGEYTPITITRDVCEITHDGEEYVGYYIDINNVDGTYVCSDSFMAIQDPPKERFVIATKYLV